MNIFLSKQKWVLTLILQASMLALTSCEGDNFKHDSSNYISWNVVANGMQNGRALVEDIKSLETACSNGNSIGIKSSYVDKDGEFMENVLGNARGDVSLIYQPGTTWDNHNGWTYGEIAAMWCNGAKYTFNAYYPKTAVGEITQSATSPFVIKYNTKLHQEDLMMAYTYVEPKDHGKLVTLNMLHVLSALKFNFCFMNADGSTFDDSDALTAFWLENTVGGNGLYSIGQLEFGSIDDYGFIDGENIKWTSIGRPGPAIAMYAWEDANGVEFPSKDRAEAAAYSTNYDGKQMFTDNDAFILVIPQVNDGTIDMCFKLKSTGEQVHRVKLPNDKAHTFEPGIRYTYNIRFGQTSVDVDLRVAEWNKINSSHDLPL